jgi:hypothetical protein
MNFRRVFCLLTYFTSLVLVGAVSLAPMGNPFVVDEVAAVAEAAPAVEAAGCQLNVPFGVPEVSWDRADYNDSPREWDYVVALPPTFSSQFAPIHLTHSHLPSDFISLQEVIRLRL